MTASSIWMVPERSINTAPIFLLHAMALVFCTISLFLTFKLNSYTQTAYFNIHQLWGRRVAMETTRFAYVLLPKHTNVSERFITHYIFCCFTYIMETWYCFIIFHNKKILLIVWISIEMIIIISGVGWGRLVWCVCSVRWHWQMRWLPRDTYTYPRKTNIISTWLVLLGEDAHHG